MRNRHRIDLRASLTDVPHADNDASATVAIRHESLVGPSAFAQAATIAAASSRGHGGGHDRKAATATSVRRAASASTSPARHGLIGSLSVRIGANTVND